MPAWRINGCAVIGYVGFGFLADAFGRKSVTIFYIVGVRC